MDKQIIWSDEAKELLKSIPFLFRGFAKKAILKKAKTDNVTVINAEYMEKVRAERNAKKQK